MHDIFSKRVVVSGRAKRQCAVCGQLVADHAMSRAAHGKKHVKRGEATAYTEWGADQLPRTVYRAALPKEL